MSECPDAAPAPGTTSLSFVQDGHLRESLRLDVSAAGQALQNAEWKAATVLAGSVIEALLLCAVEALQTAEPSSFSSAKASASPAPPTDLNKWRLAELVPVAEAAGLIVKDTAKQCELAREFRNLIHPGRSLRLGQECDRGTALSANVGMELVVRDLGA